MDSALGHRLSQALDQIDATRQAMTEARAEGDDKYLVKAAKAYLKARKEMGVVMADIEGDES